MIEQFIKTQDKLALYVRPWRIAQPKAVVVHAHGWCEHTGRHEAHGAQLAQAGYSFYAYDARGHGRSDGKRGHTPSVLHMVEDLNRVVQFARQDSGCNRVFVSGNSMGGGVAINYACNSYAGLSGVIATSPWLRLVYQPRRWMLRLGRAVGTLYPAFSLKSPKGRRATLVRDGSVDRAIESDPYTHRMISAQLYFGMVAFGEYLMRHADELRVPVLVQHGTADRVTSHAASAEYVNRVQHQDKRFISHEGAFHELHSDAPDAYYASVIEWLDAHVK